MNKDINVYMVCLVFVLAIVMASSPCMAQFLGFGDIWNPPAFQSQPLQLPTWSDKGDILVDNFEYWDSPYNHGWVQSEPPYPVYGFGLGYATAFNTVLDLQEGSRVLDVYRPASVFLLGTNYERHYISKYLSTPPASGSPQGSEGIDLNKNGVLSFKFRAPLGIELWDIFQFEVSGISPCPTSNANNDIPFTIQIRPVQPDSFSGSGNTAANISIYQSTLLHSPAYDNSSSILLRVDIGRNFLDGSWHVIWLDLRNIQSDAYTSAGVSVTSATDTDGNGVPDDEEIKTAYTILASGQMFRLDDICFRESDYALLDQVDLFEPGPLYAQIFEPYRYLFMADYETDSDIPQLRTKRNRQIITDFLLDTNNFILDTDTIRGAWVSDLLKLDPNYHAINPNHPTLYDPNYTNRWSPDDPNFGMPDPVAEQYLGNGFFVDISLPVFSDPNLRIAGNRVDELKKHGALGWNMTVNGYGANAIQALLLQPLSIYPYDGMPTYIPAYYSSISAIKAHGAHHYGPYLSFMLESALWNSGITKWPNIAYMDYTPQYFEDLILTIEVTDGRRSDVRTFPMSVVNYPVENYPPVAQIYASPKIFTVGQPNEYLIKFIDPDCYIFSLAQFYDNSGIPATSHIPGWPINDWSQIRTDQDSLTYQMTLDGMTTYQYGPWIGSIIDPHTGLISFTPQFEGRYNVVITCTDDKGAVGLEDFPLLCVSSGTWLNHPPFITGCPTKPVVVKAGEEVIISSPDFIVTDPDGDEIYASCNIGSCGQTSAGGFIWTFQTNFPGTYNLEIIFYDIRGGYAVMKLLLDVKPWWSY